MKMEWTKEQMMGGWTRYTSGPYTIEKEDVRSYSVWFGGEDIGGSSSVAEAKKIARKHSEGEL